MSIFKKLSEVRKREQARRGLLGQSHADAHARCMDDVAVSSARQ
jgi:hypothetical protein